MENMCAFHGETEFFFSGKYFSIQALGHDSLVLWLVATLFYLMHVQTINDFTFSAVLQFTLLNPINLSSSCVQL